MIADIKNNALFLGIAQIMKVFIVTRRLDYHKPTPIHIIGVHSSQEVAIQEAENLVRDNTCVIKHERRELAKWDKERGMIACFYTAYEDDGEYVEVYEKVLE